jgi:hypothetical protein
VLRLGNRRERADRERVGSYRGGSRLISHLRPVGELPHELQGLVESLGDPRRPENGAPDVREELDRLRADLLRIHAGSRRRLRPQGTLQPAPLLP